MWMRLERYDGSFVIPMIASDGIHETEVTDDSTRIVTALLPTPTAPLSGTNY